MIRELLTIEMPDDIIIIAFADDIAVITVAKTEAVLMNTTNEALQRVADWMRGRRLEFEPEKN